MSVIVGNDVSEKVIILNNVTNNGIEFGNRTPILRGDRGYSNYELAVQNGFQGTEKEYLESLKGEPGSTDYNEQINKPSIAGVELINDKTFEDLGALALKNTEIEKLINRIVL